MTAAPRHFVTPRALVEALVGNGVTHVPYLPDSEHAATYDLLKDHPSIRLVRIAREGEALAIAAGLVAGGKRPLPMIQNTGFFESGDSIRGFGLAKEALPMVIAIGYRGWVAEGEMRDTAAVYTEPILKAWGIPYRTIAADSDLYLLARAFEEAERTQRLNAVLLVEDEHYASTQGR